MKLIAKFYYRLQIPGKIHVILGFPREETLPRFCRLYLSLSLMLHSYSLLLTYIHCFPDYCRTTMVSSKLKTKAPETSLLHPYMKNILLLVSPSNCTTIDNQGCIARSFTLETPSSPESYAAKMYYGMVQCLKNSVPCWVFLKERTYAE
jgi:hypothetical protein